MATGGVCLINFIIYLMCIILFIFSFIRDSKKTKSAFVKGVKSLEAIMPQFFLIVIIIAIILSVLDTESISKLIGEESKFIGTTISSVIGAVTMMPTFVAFSVGDSLLKSGAGYAQVAAFISTSTMVGILTFPLESKFIGKKAAFYRNVVAFLFAFVVASFVGGILG